MRHLLLLLVLFSWVAASDRVEVYLVTHSHDDVGWTKTIEEYYQSDVKSIITTCVEALTQNPARKYTQVETAFFSRWWRDATDAQKQQVRKVVASGQLEFNLGGMCMNDEAATTYLEEINQMTDGAEFLMRELGAKPAAAWHIDPFGHSAATASLWSQIGFPAFILNRLPYFVKDKMKAEKGLEFIWEGSSSLGESTAIFCHVMDNHYSTPTQIDFSAGWNVSVVAENFAKECRLRSTYYAHNKLLIPYGDDFKHVHGVEDYTNMDKLINYINANQDRLGVHIRYAVVSDYIKAVNSLNLTWSVFRGDFFPYVDSPNQVWTGYFSTKPELKHLARKADSFLAAAESFLAMDAHRTTGFTPGGADAALAGLRYGTAVVTHHDGITGTEVPYVAVNYAELINSGRSMAETYVRILAESFGSGGALAPKQANLYVVNPLAWARTEVVSVLTNSSGAIVTGPKGETVLSQVNPVPKYSQGATHRLYFLVNLGPMEKATYHVKFSDTSSGTTVRTGTSGTIKNSQTSLSFGSSGKLESITDLRRGRSLQATFEYVQYQYVTDGFGCFSGFYFLRTQTDTEFKIPDDSSPADFDFDVKMESSRPASYQIFHTVSGQSQPGRLVSSFVGSLGENQFKAHLSASGSSGAYRRDLQLDYVAWHDFAFRDAFPSLDYRMGSASIQPSSNWMTTVTVKFDSAQFSRGAELNRSATVILSVQSRGGAQKLLAGLVSSDDKGFVANIFTENSGWTESATLNWFAIPSGSHKAAKNSIKIWGSGPQRVQLKEEGGVSTFNAAIPQGPNDPLVLVTPWCGQNEAVAVGIQGKSATSIRGVAKNLKGKTQNSLQVSVLVLPRMPNVEKIASTVTNQFVEGPLVSEVQQSWATGYGHTYVMYQQGDLQQLVETYAEVGTLNKDVRDLSIRLSTSMSTRGELYTDDNGLEIMKRTFDPNGQEIMAPNYYPMVQRASLKDKATDSQINLLSDSSHGVASLNEGEMEVMVQRRCGDCFFVRPALWLSYSGVADGAVVARRLSVIQQNPLAPIALTKETNVHVKEAIEALPQNVQLLSFRFYNDSTLVRLHHIYAVGEHPNLSAPVKVDLAKIYGRKINKITETNLVANTAVSEMSPLKWKALSPLTPHKKLPLTGSVVVLQALEIRTFLIQ